VYRTRVDRCNRLWVVDSGVITTLDNFSPVCPPKIFVFDLQTDTLVHNIVLPREVSTPSAIACNFCTTVKLTLCTHFAVSRVQRKNFDIL
jgi:hypothetical protein